MFEYAYFVPGGDERRECARKTVESAARSSNAGWSAARWTQRRGIGFGAPEMCDNSSRTVIPVPYGPEPAWRGTGLSRPPLPASTSRSTAAAVIVLLIEYAIIVVPE